ncbi:MAG: glycosyltransferase family 4 protein [Treponema sp.]|jgi:1,2-diacylglycerol 3-alpha-glucosyltransferase|nr:glycosyltransferase family 4 protein [Treponema sp.]
MNIGIFSDCYTPQVNGVVTVVRTLKTELERRGHKAYIFTVQHPNATEEEGVFRIPSFQFPAEPQHRVGIFVDKMIYDMARPLNLDLIHTHTEFSLFIASEKVSKKLHIPAIHTLHTYYLDYLDYALPIKFLLNKNLPAFIRFILRNPQCVIVPSKKNADYLVSINYSKPVIIIPNGIDLTHFYERSEKVSHGGAALRERFKVSKDDEVIVFVGRLGTEKNVYTLLNNFKEILRLRPHAKLFLVGDGPDHRALEAHSLELGISDSVVFTGYLQWPDEIAQIYAAADLFMSASHSEVHPITFIEAMASGLPIVAAADSSIAGMVINDENGWAVEDDSRLWEKAVALLEDRAASERMGRKSEEISRNYSVERFVDAMIECYEKYKK